MSESKWTAVLNTTVNIVVIVIATGFLVRPSGPVGKKVSDARKRAEQQRTLAGIWSDLVTGPRVDSLPVAAPIVIEFGDYESPACRNLHLMLPDLVRRASVGVVYRHYPNTGSHPAAEAGAKAAICAEKLGHFREMHALLLTTDEWRKSGANWPLVAVAAGVADTASFTACFNSSETATKLKADIELGVTLKLRGSPSFVGTRGIHLGIPAPEILRELTATK